MDVVTPRHRRWRRAPHYRLSLLRTAQPLREAGQSIGLALWAADEVRRGALARLRRSRFVRWRHRAPIAYELLLAPPDLRPFDPSFADEVASGSMGLAGLTATLGGASPFAVRPPSAAWARELHGFGWLRHFAGARTPDNEALARRIVERWHAAQRRQVVEAWAPDVVGRRVISWLSHAALLLDGVGRRPHVAFLRSLEVHAGHLSASWRDAPAGYPKLLALIGWVQACLCIGGHERRLEAAEKHLIAELERQILEDGGHASRNPGILVALLLDLLPLRQCFGARDFTPDKRLGGAIDRMMGMLRRLRLGDGQLARFNGMGATERDALAMVLAYDRGGSGLGEQPTVSRSGYVRMERGAAVVVVDAGAAPPLELAGGACAGCLSFELSIGSELLLVNGGTPTMAHERATAAARATASHNTLVLAGQSSARLLRNALVRRRIGAAPIMLPARVTCEVKEIGDGVMLRATHDGYVARFGLMHARTLLLSPDGGCLDGEDTLEGANGELRLSQDVPVAVHFHLPPHAGARYGATEGTADLILRNGERWLLSAAGGALTIEAGTHFAEVLGPVQAQQVVLRTVCYGAARVRWRLERV
jgi:uncharacterized heparinase superfamily protein